MNFKARIPQIGDRGPAGHQIIETTNIAPTAEQGGIGDVALRYDDDGTVWLYRQKTEAGWPAEPVRVTGLEGQPGAAGATIILADNEPPGPVQGKVGDFALRLDDGGRVRLYGPKTGDGWPVDGVKLNGPRGYHGWAPVLVPVEVEVEEEAVVVFRMIDWIGGEGQKPTHAVGEYVNAAGDGFTADAAEALVATNFTPGDGFFLNPLFAAGLGKTDEEKENARINIGAGIMGESLNKIINGNFDVWQRGASGFGVGYNADRWRSDFDPMEGGFSASRGDFSFGQLEVPGNPKHFVQIARSSATGVHSFGQRIEGVETLAGKTATLTFYARCLAGSGEFAARVLQNFGTGGTPSSPHLAGSETFVLTTDWTRFDMVVDVPSFVAKELGTGGNDHLLVEMSFPADQLSDGTIQIARVSLVEGYAVLDPDPFAARHIAQEILLCHRYFQKSYELATAPGTSTSLGHRNVVDRVFSTTETSGVFNPFATPMRAAPTITTYSGSETGKLQLNLSSTVDASLGTPTRVGFPVWASTSGLTVGNAAHLSFHFTANAEL
ncbi:MAG: hypothetical protein ACK4GT_00075 [Pararhodobacter sp.]